MSRRYVQNLLHYKEHELEIAMVMAMAGFIQKPLSIQKGDKQLTSYTFSKKFDILVNAITSTSSKPLWGIFYTGVMITILSVLLALWLIWERLVSHTTVEGWTSVMVTVCFFNGLTVLMLGVIGVYLSKIFIEIKARPYTIVRQHLTHSGTYLGPLADIHDASLLQYTDKELS